MTHPPQLMSSALEDDVFQITRAMDKERFTTLVSIRQAVRETVYAVFSSFSSFTSTFKLYQQINLFIGLSLKLSNIVASGYTPASAHTRIKILKTDLRQPKELLPNH